MSFGGFMSLGHSHYPIPWSALTYAPYTIQDKCAIC